MSPPSFRQQSRHLLRESLLEAARDLAIARGWQDVTMSDVAARVGVSRQTVYNEFGGKPGLAEAVAAREIEAFVSGVRAELAEHGADARAAAGAAVRHALTEAERNPLIKAILTGPRGGDDLLPFLTTRADIVLTVATAAVLQWAAAHRPDLDEAAVRFAAESVVRLTVSHIMLPTAAAEPTAAALADVFVRLLGPAAGTGG